MEALGDMFKVLPLNIDLCGIACANSGFGPVYHNPYANTFVGVFTNKTYLSLIFVIMNANKYFLRPLMNRRGLYWGSNCVNLAKARDEFGLMRILKQYIGEKGAKLDFVGAWQVLPPDH